MLVLFETPAGFALFKVLDEGKLSKVEVLWPRYIIACIYIMSILANFLLNFGSMALFFVCLMIDMYCFSLQDLGKEFLTADSARKVLFGQLLRISSSSVNVQLVIS